MMDFLVQLEETGFGTWVRESPSLLAFPGILLLHTLGMGVVAGISTFIDLRILGMAGEMPLQGMQRYFPYMWVGCWINLVTGIALFIADATIKAASPVFWVKIGFVAMAVIIAFMIKRAVFRDVKKPIEMNAKIFAFASIFCWLGAITCGRLLAYLGSGIILVTVLTVGIVVLGVVAVIGAVGYLIDRSQARQEREENH